MQSWHTRSGYRQRGRDGCKAVPALSRSRGRYPCWMDQDRPQEAVRWPAGRTQRDSTRPPQSAHTPAPKHPGRLAFHFYTFSLCFWAVLQPVFGHDKAAPTHMCVTAARGHEVFSLVLDPPDTRRSGIWHFPRRGVALLQTQYTTGRAVAARLRGNFYIVHRENLIPPPSPNPAHRQSIFPFPSVKATVCPGRSIPGCLVVNHPPSGRCFG